MTQACSHRRTDGSWQGRRHRAPPNRQCPARHRPRGSRVVRGHFPASLRHEAQPDHGGRQSAARAAAGPRPSPASARQTSSLRQGGEDIMVVSHGLLERYQKLGRRTSFVASSFKAASAGTALLPRSSSTRVLTSARSTRCAWSRSTMPLSTLSGPRPQARRNPQVAHLSV